MRSVPELALNGTALSSITSGSPNCGTSNCPACSKIEGGFKSQSIEIYWSEQRSALGCLSDQRLTEKQHQGNFSQHIYRYCVDLCIIFSLAARTVQPASPSLFSSSCKTCDSLPLQFLLPYQLIPNTQLLCMCVGVFFPLHLGTECSHNVYFVFYVLVASSNITSHYIPQCTKKHISYSS